MLRSIATQTGCAIHEDADWAATHVRSIELPTAVAVPESRQQLAAVLREAALGGTTVAAAGAGSKRLCGGIPRSIGLAVSTEKLNRVIEYPASDLTITVEAGITIAALRDTLAQQGQMLPLDVPCSGTATLGGTLATNLNGPRRLGYGAWRDIVIGLEFATSDGKLAKGGGKVVKNVAGYDVPKLLIGSFGTLGVIAEVSLKVFPVPPQSASFVFGYRSAQEAAAAARTIRSSQYFPQALQLVDAAAGHLAGEPAALASPYSLIVSMAGPSVVLERAQRGLPALLQDSGALSAQQLDGAAEVRVWQGISELTPAFLARHGGGIAVKAAMPLAQLGQFAEQIGELCGKPGIGHSISAQAGIGTAHLHLWSEMSDERSGALAHAAEQSIAIGEQLGGRATAEWFAPEFDGKMHPWGTLGGDFALMRKIKDTLDPQRILNPGRFYGEI